MATAKALFTRHAKDFESLMGAKLYGTDQTILYSACVIAEIISNEPDVESRVCPKCSRVD